MELIWDTLEKHGLGALDPEVAEKYAADRGVVTLGLCGVPCVSCTRDLLLRRAAMKSRVTCPRVMRGMRIRPRLGPRDVEKDRATWTAIELGLPVKTVSDRVLLKLIAEVTWGPKMFDESLISIMKRLSIIRLPVGLGERIARLAMIRYMGMRAKAARGVPHTGAWQAARARLRNAGLKRCGEKVLRSFNFERFGTAVTYHVRDDDYSYAPALHIIPSIEGLNDEGVPIVSVKVALSVSMKWYRKYREGRAREGDILHTAGDSFSVGPGFLFYRRAE